MPSIQIPVIFAPGVPTQWRYANICIDKSGTKECLAIEPERNGRCCVNLEVLSNLTE